MVRHVNLLALTGVTVSVTMDTVSCIWAWVVSGTSDTWLWILGLSLSPLSPQRQGHSLEGLFDEISKVFHWGPDSP